MVDCVANPMMVGAAATGKVRGYYLTIGSTLLSTLPLAFWAVSAWGKPEWVFAVLLCTTLLAQVFRLFICRGLFGLSIPDFLRRALWRIVLTGVPCIAAPLALLRAWNPQSVAGHFGFVALCLLWTALSVGALGLEGRERQFVFQKFNRLIHKR